MRNDNNLIIAISAAIVILPLVMFGISSIRAFAAEVDPAAQQEVNEYGSTQVIVTYVTQAAADAAPAEHRFTTSPAVLVTVDAPGLAALAANSEVTIKLIHDLAD